MILRVGKHKKERKKEHKEKPCEWKRYREQERGGEKSPGRITKGEQTNTFFEDEQDKRKRMRRGRKRRWKMRVGCCL